jgi:hypothetical protein
MSRLLITRRGLRAGGMTRRGLLVAGAASIGSALLTGCDPLFDEASMRPLLDFGQWMSLRAHRSSRREPLVRNTPADISPERPTARRGRTATVILIWCFAPLPIGG